jgi:transposase
LRRKAYSAVAAKLAAQAETALAGDSDCQRMMTAPSIGPTTALTILAEAGDLRPTSSPQEG